MERGAEWLRSRLFLDPAAGKLFWRAHNKYHPDLTWKEAGCARASHSKPYWVVKLDGVPYKRGRIVYCMTHGRWPTPCVDHINGDSLDDRPDNLREASFGENAKNVKSRRKASPLPMGVRQDGNKYGARISCDRVHYYLGMYATPEEAEAAYRAARERLFGEFA